MSAQRLLLAVSALALGCAGRALPPAGAAAPMPPAPAPAASDSAFAQPVETAPPAPARSEYGAHGPPAFPQVRGSAAAVATYAAPMPDEAGDPGAPPADGSETPSSAGIVEVPDGVTPVPPFDTSPAPFHPPPLRPPPPPAPRWVPPPLPPPRVTVTLPGGEVCLQKLARAGVEFRPLDQIRGVETPIQIQSAIGGIRYHSGFGPMVTDCRFALALATAAPQLAALGVSEMRFSGAYSYRMSRVGRLSLHAYGLALDVHEVVVDGRRLSVERDFARGIGCGSGPALNRVACRLRELGLFRELLTPDYNADHDNHFHLGIAPLGPLATELWVKRRTPQPSPQLPAFGNGSRTVRAAAGARARPTGKTAPDLRRDQPKSPARSRDAGDDPQKRDARQAAKPHHDGPEVSKKKREQAASKRASVKKGAKKAGGASDKAQEEKRVEAAPAQRKDDLDQKTPAKTRKSKTVKTPEKKQKRVKAAERNDEKRDSARSARQASRAN